VILLISPNSSMLSINCNLCCDFSTKLVDEAVQPLTFWFSSRDRFPKLFELAFLNLSVAGNSVDAERSASRYTLVNAPQRQKFADQNLALHAMMVFNTIDVNPYVTI